ncbi:polyphosphate kinase 2, partial [Rhizobium phaseoli]
MDENYEPAQTDGGAGRVVKDNKKKKKSWDYDKEIGRLQVELAHLQAW